MSHNRVTNLLVCYDIRDEKRLQRIHRCMKGWGMPLQYSVFFCQLAPKARNRMENELRQKMDEKQDDIRVYGIKSLKEIEFIGCQPTPDGITLLDTNGLQIDDTL